MNLKKYNKVYFLGIGGIGMSAIAQWFKTDKRTVAGYDRTPSNITKILQDMGIAISFNDTVESIPKEFTNDKDHTLVIYTPAIPKDNAILNYFLDEGYTITKRSQSLSELVTQKNTIAVAGTHGKTSISSMLAYLLSKTEQSCSAFLGGVVNNFNSNVLINPHSELMVVEADEFDRSFLTLFPQTAIISAIDADHLDIYKDHNDMVETFHQFVTQVSNGGNVLVNKNVELHKDVNARVKYYTYSASEEADFYATNIRIKNGKYCFDVVSPFGQINDLELGVPGLYNVENAVAAIGAALIQKANSDVLKRALAEYQGVKRRFDIQLKTDKVILIDDYAHHPTEIETCIKSVRHLHPNKIIAGVFQPHLFTRTRDFLEGFAKSLDLLDKAVLIPIYPAREEPIEGITSKAVLNKMTLKDKFFCEYNDTPKRISEIEADIYLIMGAGDIDRLVTPIKQELLNSKVN